MSIDSQTIDRIVSGVLRQLSANGRSAAAGPAAESPRDGGRRDHVTSEGAEATLQVAEDVAPRNGTAIIEARVVTADVLLSAVSGSSRVVVTPRAIITPSAWDVARERGIAITRNMAPSSAAGPSATNEQAQSALAGMLIVVRHTEAVEQLSGALTGPWRREVLGCPDEAASLARSAICRGEAPVVVIFAEQIHRAACLANRSERVRAVAVRDAADVARVGRQLRANVWCLDPTDRSWFELRHILSGIMRGHR